MIITDSEDAILALKPDCAVMALNIRDPMQAQGVNEAWHIKLLEAGINVVTASDGSLVYPPAHIDQAYVARLRAAGEKVGQRSMPMARSRALSITWRCWQPR